MKDKYEISLWEDYLVPASGNVPAHYEERKLCVIGSDTMTAFCRAYAPQLKSDINGTHTLTFKMYYNVKENDAATATLNPFLNLLVNERKVKCYWKGEWYDFIIKNCREDSNGKSITYTCTDLFINELSKNGFSITLDSELENNCGTVLELADYVLDGTDWKLDSTNSDTIQQTKEEPVYEIDTLRSWSLTNQTTGQSSTIPANSKVLVYYQQVQDVLESLTETSTVSKTTEIQLGYASTYETDTNSQLVTNADCYSASVLWTKEQYQTVDCLTIGPTNNPFLRIFYKSTVSANYRAERFVKQPISKLDSLTGKYCNVLVATRNGTGKWTNTFSTGDEIYKYKTTEWNDALIANNLVVNAKDFVSNEGWLGDNNLTFQLYPPYSSAASVASYSAKSYLHLSANKHFYNAGVRQSSNFIPDGFSIGETYIFRYKARTANFLDYARGGIRPTICTYEDSGAIKIIDTSGPTYFDAVSIGLNEQWVEWRMTCQKSITRADIYQKKIALFLKVTDELWLEEAQLFKEIYGADGVRINPGDIDIQSVSTIKYVYFNHTRSQGLLSPDDITYLWSSTTDWDNSTYMQLQYNENFEKIRTVTAKQSNRFNLIQTFAQTFECWAQFIINHDSTGRTIYNSDGTPQKYVRFKKEIGQETGIGFVYGIDLKTITRTIQSDKIVTKTIVNKNSNEFATNGFCTISRSKENYPRTSFLLNFDYYISQGLLNGGVLNNDLYDSTGNIGYYYWLNKYNTEYDSITEFLEAKRLELLKQQSYQTVYEGTITSLQENISNLQADLINLANAKTWNGATSWIKKNANQDQVKSKMTAIKTQEDNLATYQTMKTKLDRSVSSLQSDIEAKEERQEQLVDLIKGLDLKFYKKYSRFIQEGTWISEDYIDDDLYYLDAQSVAYTSSRPQIQYDISVIRISSIEEFKNKVFNLGDIAFIQDTDFFGYTYVNGIKTPYKEKVLISEITSNFDEPEKDTFKVQNYKTQFEDLFQRITSTTQSLQYASGEYARAANIVEPTGVINSETLQNSIALNEQLVYSAQNEAIITDSTGITVSDSTNPNKKTKVTSGGIFITTDGGATWKNAIRGEGIATQYLTTGSINTNSINIMDGNFKTFRWDESGINAYYVLDGDEGVNLSKFVRFDHFGIYGIDTDASQGEAYEPESEDDIWNDAKFGMTWKGFFVKNKYGNHSVEISSTDDIRVMRQSTEIIKIGKLEENEDVFGIRIADLSGHPVMETDSDGKLWLRKRLDISSTNGTDYNIGIGYLSEVKPDTSIHEVFNANDAFLVYEDGSMKATDGEFTGTIHATGGTIGNVTIAEVEQAAYRVDILSDSGTIFKNGQGQKVLTAELYKGDTKVTEGTFTYTWYLNDVQLVYTTKSITVTAGSLNEVYTYRCDVTYRT